MKSLVLLSFALTLLVFSTALTFSIERGDTAGITSDHTGNISQMYTVKRSGFIPDLGNVFARFTFVDESDVQTTRDTLLGGEYKDGANKKGPFSIFLFGLGLIGIASFTRKTFIK